MTHCQGKVTVIIRNSNNKTLRTLDLSKSNHFYNHYSYFDTGVMKTPKHRFLSRIFACLWSITCKLIHWTCCLCTWITSPEIPSCRDNNWRLTGVMYCAWLKAFSSSRLWQTVNWVFLYFGLSFPCCCKVAWRFKSAIHRDRIYKTL